MIDAAPILKIIVLTFAWFAGVNAIASALIVGAAKWLQDGIVADPRRARRLALMRLAPAGIASVTAGIMFLPAHIRLEPPMPDERLGLWAYVMAFAGLALVAMSLVRLCRIWRTARLSGGIGRRLQRGGVRLTEVPLLPGIALAGIVRPRILIGSPVRRLLTGAELDVAVAHERAHQQAGDNLTRLLMRCAPDFLSGTRTARRLEMLWAGEAECLADAAAVGRSTTRAARLASALVKIGRLAAGEQTLSPEWSTLHHPSLLELRVRRLVSGARTRPGSRRWTYAAAALATAVATAAWLLGVPDELHYFTEQLVNR